MNSDSVSYTYLDAILHPYIEAFDRELQKYYQQISDLDIFKLEQLSNQEKRNWGYLSRNDFDSDTKENIYKVDLLRRVVIEVREIGESYHRSHSEEHYLASQLFYEIKVKINEKINDNRRNYNFWKQLSIQYISRTLRLDNVKAKEEQDYRCGLSDFNINLYSEALRIIDEVRKQVDNKQ